VGTRKIVCHHKGYHSAISLGFLRHLSKAWLIWLVGWLVFNGTFSIKKLYHAIGEECVKTVVKG